MLLCRLDGMVSVLGAGTCCVLKPSEMSVHCSAVLAELIPKYLDPDCVKVELGAVAETTALLRERWDHILYTGNGAVGRVVLTAAAKHLTPCTLELGGKSPVYIDKSAKIDTAVTRLNIFKFLNAGQTCIAPDYILVHTDVADEFVAKLTVAVEKVRAAAPPPLFVFLHDWSWCRPLLHARGCSFPAHPLTQRPASSPPPPSLSLFLSLVQAYSGKNSAADQYGRIINSRHVQRVASLVESSTGTVVSGGKVDVEDNFVAPTLILNPGMEDKVMQQEIFGPVLPILAVDGVDEAIAKIQQVCDTPLGLYIFTEDQAVTDKVLSQTTSGGVVINGAMEHFSNGNLPFGGVGDSGMGAYHGKWGFDEFTHKRAVMVKDTTFIKGTFVPPPPYKDGIYDTAVKLTITGFLTPTQRTALKVGAVGVVAFIADRVFGIRSRL
jgi:acyl-CoA reductase-like NAD-dependent aldehyde dehydrogenase